MRPCLRAGSPSGMKGTAGTLPCPTAQRGHQVNASHAGPARAEPTRFQCRERASSPWKVVRGRRGRAGSPRCGAAHRGVWCLSRPGAGPASRRGSAPLSAAGPALPKVSSGVREGRREAGEDHGGTGAGRGRSSLSVLLWLPPGGRSGATSSSLNLFPCFHSGSLQRSRINCPYKRSVGIFNGYVLLSCEIYLPACVSLGVFRKNKLQSLSRKRRAAVRLGL